MARRGRPAKPKLDDINLEQVIFLVSDAYSEICQGRENSDFSGHDYAYKAGYMKAALENIMRELHIN